MNWEAIRAIGEILGAIAVLPHINISGKPDFHPLGKRRLTTAHAMGRR